MFQASSIASRTARALPLHRLYLSSPDGAAFTESERNAVLQATMRHFQDFTVTEAIGGFRGRRLHSLVIAVATADDEAVDRFADALRWQFGQETIGHETDGMFSEIGARKAVETARIPCAAE